MTDSGFITLQDWTDYDQSLVSSTGEAHYRDSGIKIYSSHNQVPVPNEITNSYPHALSLVKILKEFLKTYSGPKPLKILDAGCGSGVFARHFLIAAQTEGILDELIILLADHSKKALEEIKSKGILKEFSENKNYKLLELNLLDLDSCTDLQGNKYKLEKLNLVVLNYAYDSLPMIVLRPSIDSKTTYEKLQFKVMKQNTGEVFFNSIENLGSLLLEDRWQAYEIDKQNALQQKYYELLEPSKTNHLGQIFYSYGSLALSEELSKRLADEGLIFAAEMPHHQSFRNSFQVYGNAVAHFINEALITKLMHKLNYSSLVTQDSFLVKIFYFKNPNTLEKLDPVLKEVFIETSLTDIYADMRQCLSVILSPHSKKFHKELLDKFLELDSHSCFSYFARANYYIKQNDQENLNQAISKISELDYLGDYS